MGTSPLLGSKGLDNNGLRAKPPDFVLEETPTSTKSSRTKLLSVHGRLWKVKHQAKLKRCWCWDRLGSSDVSWLPKMNADIPVRRETPKLNRVKELL